MILPERTIRELLSARHRRRVLHLPVTPGVQGAILRCPMREGGVYRLVTASPVTHKRHQAELMRPGSRAAQVLLFIDLAEGRVPTWKQLTVTVTAGEPVKAADMWHVPVQLGDRTGPKDRPVFLSSIGDYTFVASKQAVPGDPEVVFPDEKDLEAARRRAKDRRSAPATQSVRAMRDIAESCKGVMTTMRAENRRKLIVKELAKLEAEVA